MMKPIALATAQVFECHLPPHMHAARLQQHMAHLTRPTTRTILDRPATSSSQRVPAGTSINYKTTTVYDSVSTKTIATDTTRTITVVASATPQTVTVTASGCRKQVEELVRVTLMPETRPTDITLTRKAYMSYCPFQEAQDREECYTYWSTIWA